MNGELQTDEFSDSLAIHQYMHCGLCLNANLQQNISVGWTRHGLQVWCDTHQANMLHIDFEGHKHPGITTRKP